MIYEERRKIEKKTPRTFWREQAAIYKAAEAYISQWRPVTGARTNLINGTIDVVW